MLAFSSVMQQNKMHCSERVNSIFTRSRSQWVEIIFNKQSENSACASKQEVLDLVTLRYTYIETFMTRYTLMGNERY